MRTSDTSAAGPYVEFLGDKSVSTYYTEISAFMSSSGRISLRGKSGYESPGYPVVKNTYFLISKINLRWYKVDIKTDYNLKITDLWVNDQLIDQGISMVIFPELS